MVFPLIFIIVLHYCSSGLIVASKGIYDWGFAGGAEVKGVDPKVAAEQRELAGAGLGVDGRAGVGAGE
jgi:hypothetical protein